MQRRRAERPLPAEARVCINDSHGRRAAVEFGFGRQNNTREGLLSLITYTTIQGLIRSTVSVVPLPHCFAGLAYDRLALRW